MEMRLWKALVAVLILLSAGLTEAGINSWTAVGPEGGPVSQVRYHSGSPSTIYMIAGQEFYRTVDGAQTWRPIAFEPFPANRFVVDPSNPDRVYAIASLRPYLSSDAGASFTALPGPSGGLRQLAVAADGTVYGINDSNVVYRSTDRGENWQSRGVVTATTDVFVGTFEVDPTNSNVLYATMTQHGLYASVDGGASWQRRGLAVVNELSLTRRLLIDASTPTRLWAHNSVMVLVSNDSGGTWNAVYSPPSQKYIGAMTLDPVAPGKVYLALADGTILLTTDVGAQWANVAKSRKFVSVLEINPGNPAELLVGTPAGVEVGTVGGASWTLRNSGVFANSIGSLAASATQDRIYVLTGNDLYTLNQGATVTPSNSASLAPSFGAGHYPQTLLVQSGASDTLLLVAGNRVTRSVDNGNNWAALPDLAEQPLWIASSPNQPSVLYAGGLGTGVIKSLDGGQHWAPSSAGLPPAEPPPSLSNQSRMHAGAIGLNTGVLYVGTGGAGVFKSADAGLSWQPANSGISDRFVRSLVIDPRDDRRVIAATSKVMARSTDGGTSWSDVGPVLQTNSSEYFADLEVDSTNPQIVYAVTSDRLLRSIDAGVSWESARIPQAKVWEIRSVVVDPRRPSAVLVGTFYAGLQQFTFAPNLSVALTPPPSLVRGTAASYVVRVQNNGPYDATGVRLAVQLPSSAGSVSVTGTPGATCTATGTSASCSMDELRNNTVVPITVTATPSAVGAFAMNASITAAQPDGTPGNESASDTRDVADTASSGGGGGGGGASSGASGGGGGGGFMPAWMICALAAILGLRSRAPLRCRVTRRTP